MNDEARPNLEPIEKMVDELGVGAVFGEPIREVDVSVVPVAEVRFAFGYGYGSGRGHSEEAQGSPRTDEGSGGGSGATGRATAKGYIRISADEIRFEPLPDVTRLALAGIAFAAWSVFWIGRTMRAVGRRR
ncbi:MAG TPA: spore germination protein GerW family protein [Rubrobacter sp.]|nr:spore germination protein GerW family protein [Rubrobacter sp.]